ncbi:hypothetical protein BJX70DRAFT_378132 [Aspergillus crustosus]
MESLSSRPGRMAIGSLLNPPVEAEKPTPSPKQYGPLTPQYSPLYPPSPNQYYYSFSDSHHQNQHQHPHHQNQHTHTHAHAHHHHHNPYSQHHTPSSQDHSFMPYRPRSTDSSPETYSRDRYDSVSSSSSTNNGPTGDRRRPPRPKYEEEEMYFIWYHRVDLCQEWKEVRESFNRQFPNRQRRGFQGIQCKFYRFIKEKKCPTLREQRRMRDGEFMRQESTTSFSGSGGGAPQFGVVEWIGAWYPWMRENREEVMRRKIAR